MLPKIYRLPAREKLNKTRNISTEYFRVFIQPNNLNLNRFGFVISKKIDKKAVGRNRMRRVLSEAVRRFVQTGNSLPTGRQGKDVLIIVKKSFISVPSQVVNQIIGEILSRIFNLKF